ncbi:MAG TPA: aspartate aminotransferase family protein [Thermopetrobacter sp.]|nr:aspartate aminotransferase family protein [Thermopetrobacter sp.]
MSVSARRPTHMLHRTLRDGLPRAVRAAGVHIFDDRGRSYLDASGGAAVSCLGHGHPRVIAAVRRQLETMAFAHTAFFTNEPAEELADALADRAPGGDWRVFFLSGGSEANEAALKLARQIQIERGEPTRDHIISRRQSYHGATIGGMSISGRTPIIGGPHASPNPFAPLFSPIVRKIVPCYPYRWQRPEETEEDYAARTAGALEEAILDIGPERVCAFIAETVVGATLGAVAPANGYFRRIREICDRYGVLLILDEVMCGTGRTGTFFAFEQEGIVPDIITLAKGLSGGYQPLSAMMVRADLVEGIEKGSGAFAHGHTWVGHATACAAGAAVLRVIDEDDLLKRVRAMGQTLRGLLRERFADHPHIGDIRGRGLFMGLEFVAEKETKRPFAPAERIAARLKRHAMRRGLICYPMSGTADRFRGDHVLLAPPFIITAGELEQLVDRLAAAVADTLADTTKV